MQFLSRGYSSFLTHDDLFFLSVFLFSLSIFCPSITNDLPGGTRTRKRTTRWWTHTHILILILSLFTITAASLALALACESLQHGREKSKCRVAGNLDYEATTLCNMTDSRCTQQMLTEMASRNLENCSMHDLTSRDKGSVVTDNEIRFSCHRLQLPEIYNGLLLWQGGMTTTLVANENSDVNSVSLATVTNDYVDISQPSFKHSNSKINETFVVDVPKFSTDDHIITVEFARGQQLVKNNSGDGRSRDNFVLYSMIWQQLTLISGVVLVEGITFFKRLMDSILPGLVVLVLAEAVNYCIGIGIETWLGGDFSSLISQAQLTSHELIENIDQSVSAEIICNMFTTSSKVASDVASTSKKGDVCSRLIQGAVKKFDFLFGLALLFWIGASSIVMMMMIMMIIKHDGKEILPHQQILFDSIVPVDEKKQVYCSGGDGKNKKHGRKKFIFYRGNNGSRIFTMLFFLMFSSSFLLTLISGEFVQKTSSLCAELTNGWPVIDAEDCTSSAVAFGWADTVPTIHSSVSSSSPPGCYFKPGNADSFGIDRQLQFMPAASTGPCSTDRICACWLGAACTQNSGALVNPSTCRCGTKICSNSTGLFCYTDANQCSASVIPVCEVVSGTTENANNCTCGSSECDTTTGLFCLASSNQCKKNALCTNTHGSSVNTNDCTCGSSPCTTSTGLFCLESADTCSLLAK